MAVQTYLIVTVWKLISETFEAVGKPIIPASQLLKEIKDDQRIWDLFKNGITCTLNQVDSDNGTQQAKRYGIKSFEEGAFLAAAIRPSFDSWRDGFLDRKPYTTGSEALDKVLGSKQAGQPYILFQESLMTYFEWLGVSPAESIGLIKKISKKKIKPEDFESLENRIKKQWILNTGSENMFNETWSLMQSCIAYSFCSSHASSTSLDMCYGAYLKVHYPLEYYTVCFNNYMDDEVRTNKLNNELKYFGLSLSGVKYGFSRSKYSCDKSTNTIYKGLSSIKYINETAPEELYQLSQEREFTSFVDLLAAIKDKTTVNSRMLDILIKIDFFADFGDINKLLWITAKFGDLYGKRSIKKDMLDKYGLTEDLVRKYSTAETPTHVDEIDITSFLKFRGLTKEALEEALADCVKIGYEKAPDGTRVRVEKGISFTKLFKKLEVTEDEKARFATKTVYGKFDNVDVCGLLKELFDNTEIKPCSVGDRIRYQQEMLGYIDYKNPELNPRFFVVGNLDTKYSPRFTAYCLANGKTVEMRVRKNRNYKNKADKTKTAFAQKPFRDGDILYLKSWGKEPKVTKTDGGWTKDYSVMYNWMYDYDIVEM